MSAAEAFVTIVCGSLLGLIVMDVAGGAGLMIAGAAIAVCGLIAWAIDARESTAHRRAIRSMWRR
ncbi:MAG TPA: hypothetical protein VG328_10330 [Stellaceae bacterium]|jgi:hypothetical protein|nr:hypothetical protein [Stellaceae bacterium]